jgi:hypothetical protein
MTAVNEKIIETVRKHAWEMLSKNSVAMVSCQSLKRIAGGEVNQPTIDGMVSPESSLAIWKTVPEAPESPTAPPDEPSSRNQPNALLSDPRRHGGRFNRKGQRR